MRKIHAILLAVTIVMALFSVYSLAAINQIYKIHYEWFSQYKNSFSDEIRPALKDEWQLENYSGGFSTGVITSYADSLNQKSILEHSGLDISKTDFVKHVLLYASLGPVDLPEYRIKIVGMAQRGSTVEIMLSLNSPDPAAEKDDSTALYFPVDMVKIERAAFPVRGKLKLVFKNQNGIAVKELFCEI